ncbi:MAG: hypothetical protein WCO58_03405 [bacterium]
MQKDKTLLFDLDMTTVDWEGEGSLLKKIWEEKIPGLEFLGSQKSKKWNIADNYAPEYFERISEIYKRPVPGFYLSMPPMKGFLEQLPWLDELGHIAFVSTPIASSLFDTSDLFERREYIEHYNRVSNEKTCWIEEHIAPVLGRMPETLFLKDKSHAHGTLLFDDNPNVKEKVCMEPSWKHVLYTGEGAGFLFSKEVNHDCKISWQDERFMPIVLDALIDVKKGKK